MLYTVDDFKKGKSWCSGGAILIYSDSYRNTGQFEKFKVSYIFYSPPEI